MIWNFKPQLRAFRFSDISSCTDVKFSPNGDISVSYYNTIVQNGKSTLLKAHTAPIRSVRFSETGHWLLTHQR